MPSLARWESCERSLWLGLCSEFRNEDIASRILVRARWFIDSKQAEVKEVRSNDFKLY